MSFIEVLKVIENILPVIHVACPSIHVDASYQVSVHMAKQFQRRIFFLEIYQSETRIACGGHVC
jgi:hypothetical protein